MTQEQKARLEIDKRLVASGWIIQDKKDFNPTASLGVAVREFTTDTGPVDYLLFVERKPVGVVEAKKAEEGQNITVHEAQSKRYAESGIKWAIDGVKIRFAYEATDIITRFTDYDDEKARSREVFSFHKPETLKEWLQLGETFRNRLKSFPSLDTDGLRKCQTKAILGLEKSFGENRPRALIQMATGAGKTFTAISSVYRLLKYAKAKRVLFLVDTKNLGTQADSEFREFTTKDQGKLFTDWYDVKRLNSPFIPETAQVCISTIQRMYSILSGKELDEGNEEENPHEYEAAFRTSKPKEVVYNAKYPPEFFDIIIIDECHRSIYNLWKQVLDYFDAFQVGLTATPSKHTLAYFNKNLVSEYTHEEAVLDGVNVGFDTYIIETAITQKGSTIFRQEVERRNKLTRKKRWQMLDNDENYAGSQLDRSIVVPDQIRTVIKTFIEKLLTEIFIGRKEVPKTIVFAKSDSHADDIIQILREEFGEGNDFCRKITYKAEEKDETGKTDKPETVLSKFRNSYHPRIAVTVDMIATGTDVKPVECLLFMRDVRSSNYFEQMKGRGTRTLKEDNLKSVSPSAIGNKARFVIVDAVGVTKSHKTDSRPLERKPSVNTKELMMKVVMGATDEDTLTSLANRVTRLDKQLSEAEKERFRELSGGVMPSDVARNLLNPFNEDFVSESGKSVDELIEVAVTPFFDPKLRDFIETVHKQHEQIIDHTNVDTLEKAGWDGDIEATHGNTISSFRQFIEDNKDELDALSIIYNDSYKTRPLTERMIKYVHEALAKLGLTSDRLWQAYGHKNPTKVKSNSPVYKLMDIISLIKFELGKADELIPFCSMVDFNFKKWTFAKNAGNGQFTDEQMKWLRWIKEFISTSLSITEDDFELAPFANHGGLGRFHELFGDKYKQILEEMNAALVA